MKEAKQSVLTRIIKPVMPSIKIGIFLAAFSAFCYVGAFSVFAFIISDLTKGEVSYVLIVIASALVLAEFLARGSAFKTSHKAAFELEQILRTEISIHLAKIPLGKIISQGSARFKKAMLDDVKNLHSFVADTTPMIGRITVAPIASLTAIAIFDLRLLLVALAMFIISVFVMSFAFRDNSKYRKEYNDNQTKINASIIEFIQAMPVVRTFSDGKTSFKRYNDSLESYTKSLKEWIRLTTLASRVGFILISPILTLCAIGIFGAYFYINGTLEFGRLIGALLLGAGVAEALMPLMWLNNFIQTSRNAANSILEILDIAPLEISNSFKIVQHIARNS